MAGQVQFTDEAQGIDTTFNFMRKHTAAMDEVYQGILDKRISRDVGALVLAGIRFGVGYEDMNVNSMTAGQREIYDGLLTNFNKSREQLESLFSMAGGRRKTKKERRPKTSSERRKTSRKH